MRLLALSDLHVAFRENREIVANMPPGAPGDWLLLAGDTGELFSDIEWVLRTLSDRFTRVVWVPGNHELWTHPADPVKARGGSRVGNPRLPIMLQPPGLLPARGFGLSFE